jgi:anti-anti-sigma factor
MQREQAAKPLSGEPTRVAATLAGARYPGLAPQFGLTVSLDAARAVVMLRGELDLMSSPALVAHLKALAVQEVVLDFSELDFIDCSSLRIIVWLAGTTASVVIHNPLPQARRLLNLARFEQIVAIRP